MFEASRQKLLRSLSAAVTGGPRSHSEEPADVQRCLTRSLKRRMSTSGDPVQFIGAAHTPASYNAWRSQQLVQMPGASVPTLPSGRWPMVLWVMRPTNVAVFMRDGAARGLYVDPQVGMFSPEVAREVALASLVSTYLDELSAPVQLAPPILQVMTRGRFQSRVAPMERAWTLPPTEIVGVRR